jgi:hypothetical protein
MWRNYTDKLQHRTWRTFFFKLAALNVFEIHWVFPKICYDDEHKGHLLNASILCNANNGRHIAKRIYVMKLNTRSCLEIRMQCEVTI